MTRALAIAIVALTCLIGLGSVGTLARAHAGERDSSSAGGDGRDSSHEDLDPTALWRRAVDALAGERPGEAIAALEALGDRGVTDPVVSYDRGLAYAARVRAGSGSEQPGDLGRAAHGFEEARDLSHDAALVRDATSAVVAVRAEVARRRSRAGDPIELESGTSLGRSLVRLLPENAWAFLAALFACGLTLGIAVRSRATVKRVAVTGTTLCAVSGGLLVVTALVLSSARDVRLRVREAVLIAPSTRLLDDKHVAFVSVAPLPEGARVELLDEGADFAHVLAGRAVGWVPSSALLPIAK